MTTTATTPLEERPPYGVAALVSAVTLGVYLLTLAPTTQFWDTSEYIAAAKVLGIPHPPGNPLFVVLAHVWAMLPLAATYAVRLNLFAAVTSAIASGLLFLVAERFLRAFDLPRWPRRIAAFAGIFVAATSFTVWNQSVVNAKVYTLSLFTMAIAFWLTVRWGDWAPGPKRDRLLLLIGYLVVLASTNHMMGVLIAPAIALYMLFTDPQGTLRGWVIVFAVFAALAVSNVWTLAVPGTGGGAGQWGVIILVLAALAYAFWRDPNTWKHPYFWAAIGAVVVGISLNYVFLPIRAGLFPPINEGEPTTWHALLDVLNRVQYQKPPVTQRQADFISQIENYLQYFSWQFGHDWGQGARSALAVIFGALGLYGGYHQIKKDPRGGWTMAGLVFTLTLLLVYYLNFKYGFSIHPSDHDLPREVRERDYFFVASFQIWGIWAALGFGQILKETRDALAARLTGWTGWAAASPVLLLALIPLAGNHLTASRAHETLARDFAVDLLQSVEPYGILITAGDNDMFPLWYAQEVEGVRTDVVLANQSLMNTDWHVKQLIRRPVYPFDSANAAAPYRNMHPVKPTWPLLPITVNEVDSLPYYWNLPDKSVFHADSLTAVLNKGDYDRATLVTLRMIQQNLGKRPIYFARTTGQSADALGLGPYLLGEGFARKLLDHPVQPSDSVVFVRGIGWVDLARTQQLLFDVYHYQSADRNRPRGWVDIPSQNILSLYYITYAVWAQAAEQAGDTTSAATRQLIAKANDIANRVMMQTSFGRQIAAESASAPPPNQ